MALDSHDFPFGILDVAALLRLKTRRPSGNSVYTDCPLCGDRRGKLNLNHEKDVWRCNYCGEKGGMLALYAKVYGITQSEAYREICETLKIDGSAPDYQVQRIQPPPDVSQSPLASINEIHQTLSLLFHMLTLSDMHKQKLRQRGLSDRQIECLGYKSTPPPCLCRSYTEWLMQQGCAVQGVPGFYLGEDGKWTVKFHKRTAGIIIPVKGIDGLVRGAQIRLDTPIKDKEDDPDKDGTKYLWLSSSNKNMGVTSGSPIHFVGEPFAKTVYVTEGFLKADIAHCLMDRSFAAMAGANNTSQLDPLFALLAQNGTELIVEAQDMDKYRNEQVAGGASKIYLMARRYGMNCRRLTWNPNHKGIDDWQLALRKKELKMKEDRRMNFKERFLAGLSGFEALDGYVKAWHSAPEDDVGLPQYLGLTDEEYGFYLREGDAALEQELLRQQRRQHFRIYQLEFGEDAQTKPYAFSGIEALRKAGYEQPPAADYRLVCDSVYLCGRELLEKDILCGIFSRYNDTLPQDYSGRSLSPSDVVELYDNEKRQYFYRDLADFVPVRFSPKFAQPMKSVE